MLSGRAVYILGLLHIAAAVFNVVLMGIAKYGLKLRSSVGEINGVHDAVHGRSFEIASRMNDLPRTP